MAEFVVSTTRSGNLTVITNSWFMLIGFFSFHHSYAVISYQSSLKAIQEEMLPLISYRSDVSSKWIKIKCIQAEDSPDELYS